MIKIIIQNTHIQSAEELIKYKDYLIQAYNTRNITIEHEKKLKAYIIIIEPTEEKLCLIS